MGVKHSGKGVKHSPAPCQHSLGNSGDANVRVAVAGENKDGIDGHRHGTPLLEYTGNLSGVVVGRLVRTHPQDR